jgi:hypothetical protein
MSVISKRAKRKVGVRAAKTVAKRPQLLLKGAKVAVPAGKAGLIGSKPFLRRRARKRIEKLDKASRTLGEALAVYAPQAAYEMGLADPPKPRRAVPRVAVGVLVGAGAMYLLEPGGHGREHRKQLANVIG